MSKTDIVSAQKSAILSGQDAALQAGLEAVYDQAATEQKASDGTLSQSDLDAAVAAAVAPLNQQVADLTAKDASDVAAGQAALVDLQGKLDALAAKESVEAGTLAALQSAKDSLAKVLADLSGIGAPVPVPAPTA